MSNNLATTVISTLDGSFAYSMALINVSITGSKILVLLTSTRLGCPWLRGSVLGSTAEGELRSTLASWTTMKLRKSTTTPSMSSLSRRSLVQVVLSHLVFDHTLKSNLSLACMYAKLRLPPSPVPTITSCPLMHQLSLNAVIRFIMLRSTGTLRSVIFQARYERPPGEMASRLITNQDKLQVRAQHFIDIGDSYQSVDNPERFECRRVAE
ncbi:hypothetical protein HD554DRAFT_110873 [Boletus coccyginus]|nr:hypothetical protein HD554DRAFT_110873 [Boletus coccyginus]